VSCRAELAADRTLVRLTVSAGPATATATAPAPATATAAGVDLGLVGRLVGRGFRAAVDRVCDPGSLDSVLLSELPVVALLSGYGTLYSGRMAGELSDRLVRGLPVDICAGWARSASMMVHIREKGEIPAPDGPAVPPADDADGWHAMPELAVGTLRRQRLLQRTGDDVWAMFRDTYARPDGVVSVLHEYTLTATIGRSGADEADERIVSCEATPRVLPWVECPGAAASAGRLVGQRLDDLRHLVRDDLVGTSTCTHLNALLSSLSQAAELV
jgi:hypothetical protein